MTSLAQKLSSILSAAFEELGIDSALSKKLGTVRASDRPDLCQFQCNGAMAATKHLKKPPREVAQEIIAILETHDALENLTIAGPGFININTKIPFISNVLAENSQIKTLGITLAKNSPTMVLDYGGPNIAKAMHVGHLRSSIIGDTLRRMYAFSGANTIGDIHMGDWGTPMGMILSELDLMKHEEEISMEMLAKIYPKASKDCKADEDRMALAREATRKLQDGDETYTKTWKKFIEVSITGIKKNFDALSVHFDEWKGESDAHPFIENMISDLKAKGDAEESNGALVMHIAREEDKKEVPPLILLKSDGAVLYGTTDLATIIERIQTHAPEKIIYCVDQRQSLHFEQVFRAAEKGGILKANMPELIFAGFGTMNGPDGKPFKTRTGGVMRLEDLITMGLEKARARLNDSPLDKSIDEEEREDIAHKVAIAAIKFADLQNQRQSDYIFDLDKMTAFEGKTGPYLLYQTVRIQSLLKKAGDINLQGKLNLQEEDTPLALILTEFPDHFAAALKTHAPHILCEYAYRLAQSFSAFYAACHILSEEDQALRTSRLTLCSLTHKHLVTILDLLLGIQVPERM